MWFLLGTLIGALAGCLVCVRYLRREIAADIGPRLHQIQLQLTNLETALNLALVTHYADLTQCRLACPGRTDARLRKPDLSRKS